MMNSNAKDKIIRLFQFLKQYNNIKNPVITDINNQVWRKWLDNIPSNQCIVNNIYSEEGNESQVILSVGRPVLTDCPPMPSTLVNWIERGWDNPYNDVKVKKEISAKEKDINNEIENLKVEKFESNKERIEDLKKWEKDRNAWIEKELPAREAEELFSTFYGLYSIIRKEGGELELILGDGNLLYKNEVYIDHPILLCHVQLEFNADIPEFRLVYSDKGQEIYRSIIYYIENINYELLKDINNDFQGNVYSPLELENTNLFLNRMANALSPKGVFVESKDYLTESL